MALLQNTTPQDYYQNEDYGNYQFVSLEDIINQFMFIYTGNEKIIRNCSRVDVAFHAQRALAELSFDTLKSVKSQEIEIPSSLTMVLPQDYVNYTKLSWVDDAGIKHPIYPTKHTSNPQKYQKDTNDEFLFNEEGDFIPLGELIKNGNFHGGSDNWKLNEAALNGNAQTVTTVATGTAQGDPESGWFYEKNSIRGYALPQFQAVRQENINIRSGEQYTITYTISNYVTGQYRFGIVDENGDHTFTTARNANGTYTETITASATTASSISNHIFFQTTTDNSATSGLNVVIDDISIVRVGDEETSTAWSNYKSTTPSENNNDNYEDDVYWPYEGERYGLEPSHAQVNGSFYIDELKGLIHFSSNISGQTVILDYISDSLGTESEMKVHKFAEEAMYKSILYAVASGYMYTQQIVPRLKREKFAAIRQAKLRLSNLKLEELTQILRGKSKHIKH